MSYAKTSMPARCRRILRCSLLLLGDLVTVAGTEQVLAELAVDVLEHDVLGDLGADNAVLVGLEGLVVGGVILGLGHFVFTGLKGNEQ